MRKRVPAAVLAVLLAWSLAAPALAAEEGGSEYVSQDTFWNWAAENTGGLLSAIISYGLESVCTVNEDGRHRASSYNYVKKGFSLSSGVVDEPYYKCVCDACGQEFTAYETDVKQSYDTSVAELPAPMYGADGSVYVIPTFRICHSDVSSILFELSNGETKEDSNGYYRCSMNLPLIQFEILKKLYDSHSSCIYSVDLYADIPFLCSAELLFSSATYSTNTQSGQLSFYGSSSYYKGGVKDYQAGSRFYAVLQTSVLSMIKDDKYVLAGNFILFSLADVRLKLTPYATLGDAIYNITTRPTSITGGNYGIIGDNGQITTVTNNNQIVNETNNTYYNPATGETSTITDWSYDYSDRSYNLTLEGGDTSTVTYGDENITITETTINESGDTIINNYTIYYIIEGSGSGTGSDTHTHDWRETSVTAVTCIQPGKRVYTCDSCGDTKSETISALGHNWLVLRTVNTEYDEDGALVTEGYVLYQCDRCQEQYKTTSTSSRPPPGGGSTSGSGTVLDEFPDFVDMLLEMLQQLPSLFSGFVAFLNAMFAYLPEEIIFLLTFGVAAVVLIGIIKAVRG